MIKYYMDKKDNNLDIELLKATLQSGANALKISLLINGVSTISLLTFIGKLTENDSDKIASFSLSILVFALGVFISAIASGLTYIIQTRYQLYNESKQIELGKKLNYTTIVLVGISYILFLVGIISTYCSFIDLY